MKIKLNRCKECEGSARLYISFSGIQVFCCKCNSKIELDFNEEEKKNLTDSLNILTSETLNKVITGWNEQNEKH